MKKSFILLFSLINSTFLFAQNYSINWGKEKDYFLTNGEKITVPSFNNPQHYYLNGYNQPQFKIELKGSYDDVNITILETSLLSASEINVLPHSNQIKEDLQYSVQKVKSKTIVTILPYIVKNQKIYRVNKFDLQPKAKRAINTPKIYDDSNTSVLQSGNWYKIKVKKTGVFKLDKQFFTKNGIPTAGYDLNKLKIYGNGSGRMMENLDDFRYGALQEIPIHFKGSEDGKFDDSDQVVFYAKGPHQFYRNQNTTLQNTFLRYNTYDDYSYYFITLDGGNGKRITNKTLTGTPVQTFNVVDQVQYHKIDSVNINRTGRIWLGNYMNGSKPFTKTFTTNQIAQGEKAYLSYSLVGKNAQNTSAQLSINNSTINSINFSSGNFNEEKNTVEFNPSQSNFNVNIRYNNSTNPSGQAYINYLELKYKEQLNYGGKQFGFRLFNDLNDNNIYAFNLSNNSNVNVWDVSDVSNSYLINQSNGNYYYQSNSIHFQNEFVAFKEEHLYTDVEFVGKVANQDTRAFKDVTLAIITHPSLKAEAERLAKFREEYNKIKVAVVTTDEVYNDFSSGSKDPIAIRDFLKHLKDNGNPLEYALLFGSTTYDPKNRIFNKNNLIPSFYSLKSTEFKETITTDDYFAMLSDDLTIADSKGNGEYLYNAEALDIAIGRLVASDLSEAKEMVDKIISYYQKLPNRANSFGDWRTNIVAISDDPEYATIEINTPNFDQMIDSTFVHQEENRLYAVNKLYIDAYEPELTSAGLRYPMVTQSIVNAIERGTNFMMYYGHGGPRSWAQERLITGEDLMNLKNFTNTISRVPIIATITCDFTTWDLPQYNSAGEMLVKNSTGGALSMITTNRPIGTVFGDKFNGYILDEIFKKEVNQNQSTGKALMQAKKKFFNEDYNKQNQDIVLRLNDFERVGLIGDPMIEAARPRQDIRITNFKVNGNDVDYHSYQIKALDLIEIEGEVLGVSQTVDDSFNGRVQGLLFEKPLEKALKNNKKFQNFKPYSFKEEYKTILKGGSEVVKGKFKFESYLPKDINYELDKRKLLLYAHTENTDASLTETLTVGGLNEAGLNDEEKPQGKLYFNNTHFANGGIVSSNKPVLIACLTDDFGINSSGYSIGHDIVATLDGKTQEAIVLNDYFTAGDGDQCINKNLKDYQKGQVSYQFDQLELGNHTIELKFWDINNNPGFATLDFLVMEDGKSQLQIDKLLNWPNPFTNNTFFHFEHNCASQLEVMVQIFSVAGRLVKTIKQTVSAEPFREGFRTGKYAIEWDGLDDFGDKIGKGTYIYKVTVKGTESNQCTGSATAVERLVILK